MVDLGYFCKTEMLPLLGYTFPLSKKKTPYLILKARTIVKLIERERVSQLPPYSLIGVQYPAESPDSLVQT